MLKLLLSLTYLLPLAALSLAANKCQLNNYCEAAHAHLASPDRPPGHTRSVITPHQYALLTPESRVYSSPPPGWAGPSAAAAVITPALSAHFSMYLLNASAGATLLKPVTFERAPDKLERFLYILTGEARIKNRTSVDVVSLTAGGFVYFAPGEDEVEVEVKTDMDAIVLDRIYAGHGGARSVIGSEVDIEEERTPGETFRLQRLLPSHDDTLDFNIHIMSFDPGEYLNVKEVHYNQHGLLILRGEGIYMLAERFFPVTTGDVIYMAPFVPQWYAALGRSPTRYWLYKDTRTNALCHQPSSLCTACNS